MPDFDPNVAASIAAENTFQASQERPAATMPGFSPHNSCRKCGQGASGIATKHTQLISGTDVIRRTCHRCGFVWDERPLDRSASV